MAKITPASTIALVTLGAAGLGLPACSGENVDPRQEPQRIEVPAESACDDATEDNDPEWVLDHVMCGITAEFEAIAKRVPCSNEDPQECWKSCGPDSIGFKKLTCTGGAYVEDMCEFDPNRDYSCFRIPLPDDVHPDCPTEEAFAPRHNEPCTIPPCQVCGGNIYEQTTGYRNSSEGLLKAGYCICRPPIRNEAGEVVTKQRWRCATQGVAWPCPGGCGCHVD
jgi:hypothetical protein